MTRRAWVPPGPNAAHRCHCGVGWFNRAWYGECEKCRTALTKAIQAVRLVFPNARVVGAPNVRPSPRGPRNTRTLFGTGGAHDEC